MLKHLYTRVSYIIALICSWHFACTYFAIPEYLLPSPAAIAQTFYTNANLLSVHSLYTGIEVVAGILLAIFLALVCGVVYTFCPKFERFLRPILVVMQTMPSFLFMPFLLLWFGFGLLPKMIIVTLTGFFPITLAFIEGLKRPPAALLELESLFHATPFRAFMYLRLPAALPAFFTGLRWACLQGSVAVIAADWLGASHGLGYLILTSYSRLQIPLLFCCVIILIVYAHMLMRVALLLEGRCVFWIGINSPQSPSGVTRGSKNTIKQPGSSDHVRGKLIVILLFLFTTAATAASSKTPVKIALEWFLNPHHAPFIIAQTKGYFSDEGLDVTFYPANGSQEGCRQALQGSVDFAITHEPQVLIMDAKGMHLETVAVIIPETLEVILSAIPLNKAEKALLGKTVAHGSGGAGSLTFAVMHQVLKNLDLTENDVTIIMAKNCLVTGFIAGNIDVVFNLYRTYQLHDIKKHMKRPFFVYELKDFGVPSFASMVLVCGATVPADVKLKMTRVLQKAVDYIHNHSDAAYECVRLYRPELDTVENKDVWPLVHPIFAKDVTPIASMAALKDFLKNTK